MAQMTIWDEFRKFAQTSPFLTIAMVIVFLIFLGLITILGLALWSSGFNLPIGWLLVLVGGAWLSATAVVDSVASLRTRRGLILNFEAVFVGLGLALLADSWVISTFFYLTSIINLFFWGTDLVRITKGWMERHNITSNLNKK